MDRVEIGGLRIAFERAGDGPPLVLLHGVLGDSRDWRRQLEGLSDEFTVVAWDAPGCGESSDPDPPETFGADVYADCLAEFIEALELERPHVLGLSWGGGLALELYRRRPDLPRSLVLASAYAGWAGSLPPDEVARR
jgi:pimeloyl-ACP methyl ester carboxylesterase